MNTRKATPQEILEDRSIALSIKLGSKIRYRHFVREISCPHAEHGVSHVQYSRSKIRVVDDIPHVMYQGELVPVTGDMFTLHDGKQFVADIRIDSPYLR